MDSETVLRNTVNDSSIVTSANKYFIAQWLKKSVKKSHQNLNVINKFYYYFPLPFYAVYACNYAMSSSKSKDK